MAKAKRFGVTKVYTWATWPRFWRNWTKYVKAKVPAGPILGESKRILAKARLFRFAGVECALKNARQLVACKWLGKRRPKTVGEKFRQRRFVRVTAANDCR